MASPYILTNADLQYVNLPGQDFSVYLAFLNSDALSTNWADLNLDANGNWQAPPNYDTLYNQVPPYAPVANMGSNRIGFVGEPLYFDATGSFQRFDIGLAPDSFSWGASGTPDTIYYDNGRQVSYTWSSPGIYEIDLFVTDVNGVLDDCSRQVMIYQDRTSALPGVVSISGLSGSISTGGWQMQCTTLNSQVSLVNPDILPPGTYQPVVLMVETRYEVQPDTWIDVTLGPHGHFNPGYPYRDPRILFDGYIQSGTVHQDVEKDTLSFSCVGPQMVLQEAKTHMLGYYNCAYTTNKTGLVPSPVGNGYMINNLRTTDVIHNILKWHIDLCHFHDFHPWNSNIPTTAYDPTAATTVAAYDLIYTTLSANEGTIWSNLQDLTSNEWGQVYCERDGSIRIGPQVNFRGADYWMRPTTTADQSATSYINFLQEHGYTLGSVLANMTGNIPSTLSFPFPVKFMHPWGTQLAPPQFLQPFGSPNAQIQQTQAGLSGPPILCTFSDSPIYDTSITPTDSTILYPWVTQNWPQDLAVYPISFDITENYTGRASLVKLIGTLYGHTTLWSSWYPQNIFQPQGDGSVSVVITTLPASDWEINETHLLADITSQTNTQLLWNWWWEIAKREYYSRNMNYTATVTLGMFTPVALGDIVGMTRQNITLGPQFTNKPFVVQEISHSLDLTARTWQTTLTLAEVTSAAMGDMTPPPTQIPKG